MPSTTSDGALTSTSPERGTLEELVNWSGWDRPVNDDRIMWFQGHMAEDDDEEGKKHHYYLPYDKNKIVCLGLDGKKIQVGKS